MYTNYSNNACTVFEMNQSHSDFYWNIIIILQ